jgi:ribulose-phosphate 3-epimerase
VRWKRPAPTGSMWMSWTAVSSPTSPWARWWSKRYADPPRLTIDVHLMIESPERYINDFSDAGADYIAVHQEACTHLHRTVQLIRESGAKPGVALNPATPVESLQWILEDLDFVLIMSVNPGFGGQQFIPSALDKVAQLSTIIRERGNCPP